MSLCLTRSLTLSLIIILSHQFDSTRLPCVDEVLSQVDVNRRPRDGDLAFRRSFHGVCDFDLRSGHLSDLVNFGSLASDDAAYELAVEMRRVKKTVEYQKTKKKQKKTLNFKSRF